MWHRGFHTASGSSSSDFHRRFHKPFILQAPSLVLIFIIALALVGVLEYAARTLPLAENRPHVPDVSKIATILHRRQDSSNSRRSTLLGSSATETTISGAYVSPQSTSTESPTTTFVATTTGYLPIDSTSTSIHGEIETTSTFVATTTGYLPIDSTSTSIHGEIEITSTFVATTTGYLPMDSTSTSVHGETETIITSAFTNPSAYVATGSISTQQAIQTLTSVPDTHILTDLPPGTSGIPSKATAYYETVTLVLGSTILSTDPAGHVETSLISYTTSQTLQTTASTILIAPTSNAYLATATNVLVSTIVSTDALGHVETSLSSYTTTQTLQMTTQTSISTIVTTDASGHITTIVNSYKTVETLQPTPASTNSTQDQNPDVQTVRITWPLWWVFITGYLPIILALLVKMFWTSVYANVKLIEPFIQLSKPDGARASEILHTFYFSSNLTPDPILAFFKGKWLIFWTSLVYFSVGLLAPFASEVLFLDIHYGCGTATCWPPRLSADGMIVRILQGLLSFIAIMALAIMAMMNWSTTGVYSKPSSIAAIAALLHHPETLDDFRHLEDNISSKDMKKELGDKRYQMGTYQQQDGIWRYGIVPASQTYSPGWTQIPLRQSPETTKITKQETHYTSAILDIGFVLFVLGLLGVVVAYFMDGSNSGFNRFFNSNQFGPRFFMSFMGSVIAMNWKRLEQNVQTLTPFHRLIRSPAPASTTILFPRHSLPPLVLFASLLKGHFFAALVAITTLLADILTITLAGIPYSPNEIYLELLICSYSSMGILSLMVLVLIGFLFWKQKLKEMPRIPDSLAGVVSYLCDSYFLLDFEGCERLRDRELEKKVGREGKRYGFGRFVGVDGKKRWMVDEVDEVGVVL